MTAITQAFAEAKKSNPSLQFGTFVKTYKPNMTALPVSSPTAAPSTTVSAPSSAPMSAADLQKESAQYSKLGISDIQKMQLSSNPEFRKAFLESTYGSAAANLPEYQQLIQKDQQRQQMGEQVGSFAAQTSNAMLALEEALREKGQVNNQKIGQSELYGKAGINNFFTLNQSLNERGQEMNDRYTNFLDQINKYGTYRKNEFEVLSSSYESVMNEYNTKKEEMNTILDQVQKYQQGMELAEKELAMKKEYALWERELEAGKYDPDIKDYNRADYQSGNLRSTQTSNIKGMQVLDERDPNGDNCVLFQRAEGVKMPYGLYTIEDKRKAVQMAGRTDMGNIQIGDAILTSEGSVGHAARVVDIRDGKLILREANYKPGMVTEGREIDMNDKAILGYFTQGETQKQNSNSWSQMDRYMLKTEGLVNKDGVDKEGYNVSIEDQLLGSSSGGSFDENSEEYQMASSILDPYSDASLKDLTPTVKAKVLPIINEIKKKILQQNPGAEGVMLASAGGSNPNATFVTSMEKAGTVVNQLSALNSAMGKKSINDTSELNEGKLDLKPLRGWLDKRNPWNSNAAEVTAILQSTVPNLARGIYGEVGVLTDSDIQNYIKTLPNLSSTDDVRKLVMSATLRTVKNSIENKIDYNARSGADMSRWVPAYQKLMGEIDRIDSEIGLNNSSSSGGIDDEFLSLYNS